MHLFFIFCPSLIYQYLKPNAKHSRFTFKYQQLHTYCKCNVGSAKSGSMLSIHFFLLPKYISGNTRFVTLVNLYSAKYPALNGGCGRPDAAIPLKGRFKKSFLKGHHHSPMEALPHLSIYFQIANYSRFSIFYDSIGNYRDVRGWWLLKNLCIAW